jgi:hypothetical protein
MPVRWGSGVQESNGTISVVRGARLLVYRPVALSLATATGEVSRAPLPE